MSMTDAEVTAITLTEAELGRWVTHAPTRGLLAGPGLPQDTGPLTFAPLRAHGLRRLADATEGPCRLADELRDRLVIGELLNPAGMERESILLDGATGELTTAYLTAPTGARPFAPSLTTMLRFAAVTEELAGLRGRFASLAGQYGPAVAGEASRRLLTLFEAGTDGAVPAYWKAAALIRPLALVPSPGSAGLALEMPGRLLDAEFGHGRVARFEETDFPPTLTHEPTRRFLRETGLPEEVVDTELLLPTLTEYYADDSEPDHLIRLGSLTPDTTLVLDGRTGAILTHSGTTLHPLNTDASTLAFTLWLLHHHHTIDTHLSGELTTLAYDHLAAAMLDTLAVLDPTGPSTGGPWHYWTELLRGEAGGGL
ncbi:SUKH-4 family immunity protein [Streptomyces seoulensis]|uniref:SUKH-4 family immunity protein n=1 Tax=Streptomyces seoulensis TaxID=73044 RepID=UPI003C301ACD